MTIARSLRSLAAAALAAGLVVPMAASASAAGGAGGPGRLRHVAAQGRHNRNRGLHRHTVAGTLTGISGTTLPATLTLQAGTTTVTVTVATTTTVVRRYGGPSGLDEFTVGDHLTAYGSFETGSPTTFDARRIKDWSIQRAYTRVVGRVEAVQNGVATLGVARGRSAHSPYWHGEEVSVTLSPSTIVMSGSVTVTVDAVQPDVRVLVMGVYDRTSRTLRAYRVRILAADRRHDPVADATPEVEATATATVDQSTLAPTATPTS